MRFFLIIVCILGMIFFIDTYDKEDEEVIKVESIKPMSIDINASTYLIKEYTKKIEEFKKQRAHLGKIDNEQFDVATIFHTPSIKNLSTHFIS